MLRKRTILLILTYLSVPLMLVAVEGVLRLLAPEGDEPVVRHVSFDGEDWWELNRRFLVRYFPPGSVLVPEFKPGLCRRTKSPDGFRVIALGGSTMFGTPYHMTANIPGILRRQLRHAYPDKDIEVLNVGASAINSNVIVDLSKHLAFLEPDLVVLYMGHNEYYGPDGISAGFVERTVPGFIQCKYWLRGLRVINLLLGWLPGSNTPATDRNLMMEVSKGNKVRLGSVESDRIHQLFERNLENIIRFWQGRNTPVLVSDVSSNLMFPPFAYDTVSASGVPTATQIQVLFKEDRMAKCEEGVRQWITHDSTNAFAAYWLGRVFLRRGDGSAAIFHLERAKDNDLLKFRAPAAINKIIWETCSRMGVTVVSTDSLFRRVSSYGIPGDSLFWEHLHPTLYGYHAIASLFFDAIREQRLVKSGESRSGPLPLDTDTLHIAWLDLAYGDLSIRHLTGRWPFSGYSREPVVLGDSPEEAVSLARAVYERRLSWDQGCYQTAAYFWSRGDTRKAATTYRALLEEYPGNFYPHYLLGNLLTKTGDTGKALSHLASSVDANPRYPASRLDIGLLLINLGRFDEAIGHLNTAVSLLEGEEKKEVRANAMYGLAAAYANKGEYDTALSFLDAALQTSPGYRDALALRDAIRRERR